jgi:hypothetical protein
VVDQIVHIEDLPPFEQAAVNAQEFASAFALCQVMQEIIEKSDTLRSQVRDLSLTHAERTKALKELRLTNQQISLVASLNEIQFGISC